MSTTDELAEALARIDEAHSFRTGNLRARPVTCRCGASLGELTLAQEKRDAFAAHRAEVLAEFVRAREADAWDMGVGATHGSRLTLFAIKQVNPFRNRESSDG